MQKIQLKDTGELLAYYMQMAIEGAGLSWSCDMHSEVTQVVTDIEDQVNQVIDWATLENSRRKREMDALKQSHAIRITALEKDLNETTRQLVKLAGTVQELVKFNSILTSHHFFSTLYCAGFEDPTNNEKRGES